MVIFSWTNKFESFQSDIYTQKKSKTTESREHHVPLHVAHVKKNKHHN